MTDSATATKKIALLGATGRVGRIFVQLALDEGHSVKALVRSAGNLESFASPGLEVLEGDALDEGHSVQVLARKAGKLEGLSSPRLEVQEGEASDPAAVGQLVAGADVVVSCLGNVQRSVLIMERSAANILAAARGQPAPPRCLLISWLGCNGSSTAIKALFLVGGMGASFRDYERAEALFRADQTVPWMVVRPALLTDRPGRGRYRVFAGDGTFARPIPRADVARFLLDAVASDQWDGGQGVQLAGCK